MRSRTCTSSAARATLAHAWAGGRAARRRADAAGVSRGHRRAPRAARHRGVYLLHDDFDAALARLRKLDTVDGLEPRMRTLVEAVAATARRPAKRCWLCREYVEGEQRDVARALCMYGVRRYPEDARFPQCLGRLSRGRGRLRGGHLRLRRGDPARARRARALRRGARGAREPDARRDVRQRSHRDARSGGASARHSHERVKRWPDVPPPVAFEELELAVGLAEMSAGNVEEARVHFEASLGERETTRALDSARPARCAAR